jgi:hypothetical protein
MIDQNTCSCQGTKSVLFWFTYWMVEQVLLLMQASQVDGWVMPGMAFMIVTADALTCDPIARN